MGGASDQIKCWLHPYPTSKESEHRRDGVGGYPFRENTVKSRHNIRMSGYTLEIPGGEVFMILCARYLAMLWRASGT